MRNAKLFAAIAALTLAAVTAAAIVPARARWRTATADELRRVIPARAPVIKENIETEFRTASGVIDNRGRFIAGVVMITAGYSAEGKYSHFFLTQAPLRVGELELAAGQYVFGYTRASDDSIRVSFYRAATGEAVGDVEARRGTRKGGGVRSLLINPPAAGRANIQIGRFLLEYRVTD
ncbi:MAG TPA: hypothetical protein VF297_06185 [Pyrinomonadaceae bacterium]